MRIQLRQPRVSFHSFLIVIIKHENLLPLRSLAFSLNKILELTHSDSFLIGFIGLKESLEVGEEVTEVLRGLEVLEVKESEVLGWFKRVWLLLVLEEEEEEEVDWDEVEEIEVFLFSDVERLLLDTCFFKVTIFNSLLTVGVVRGRSQQGWEEEEREEVKVKERNAERFQTFFTAKHPKLYTFKGTQTYLSLVWMEKILRTNWTTISFQ